MKDRLIVALDTGNWAEARSLADRLSGHCGLVKVGPVLHCEDSRIRAHLHPSTRVMLDLKWHDIPETVAGAVLKSLRSAVEFMTIHAAGGPKMIFEAAMASKKLTSGVKKPKVLAVTMLTSQGHPQAPEAVVAMARDAKRYGAEGVVCSVHEARAVKEACGDDFLVVTPGIRMPWDETHDHDRWGTPQQAILAGADYLVVGRPITQAIDPVAAADSIVKAMELEDY